ncbi:MAG: hypothetical protein M1813_009845 [Trichoglossum hirsutum]|jgi:hypothetical protein|nr:MAG: hypothetical protein M1813_009845 [Trichoglossum hirsutum]
MKISIIALLAALTFVGAVQLDENDLDGLYFHEADANGTWVTRYAGTLDSLSPEVVRRSPLEKPAPIMRFNKRDSGAHCNNLYTSPSDFATVVSALGSYFGDGGNYFKGRIAYKIGSAIAFGCDYGAGQFYTKNQYFLDINAVISHCGSNGAGWNSHESWKSSYGRTIAGQGYC